MSGADDREQGSPPWRGLHSPTPSGLGSPKGGRGTPDVYPMRDDISELITPLNIATQPSARDLVDASVFLDPATPRTPKHQHAEQVMTSGETAHLLRQHLDAVVKVFAVHSRPNFELPWQQRKQSSSKSSGFAVRTETGARWLLTNAHSVSYATMVEVKRRGDDQKYLARVLAVGTECDVALLTVEEDSFWIDVDPLELGSLPALQESMAVLGYPIGGDSLAISAGVVSRCQMVHYSHGCMSLLALQTDSCINAGNSGGPVLNSKGKAVGIAFQSLAATAEGIGYIIPAAVVRHFLEDFTRNGRYSGFPALNITWQEMESAALKAACGMQPQQRGVLVRDIVPASDEASVLRTDDVILRIDGVQVGSDGTVPFRAGERVDLKYITTSKFVGDPLTLDIWREGREQRVVIGALREYQYLVPPHLKNKKPSYLVVGGLVFTPLSDLYLLQRFGALNASPARLMHKTYFGVKSRDDEEVVILSGILACASTTGYDSAQGLQDSPLAAFNGEAIHSLAQLARLLASCKDRFLRFTLEAGNKVVVMDAALARKCTAEVQADQNISSYMSEDLQDLVKVFADGASA